MTQKERGYVYQLIGLGMTGLGLVYTVPTLIDIHDTIALLAAILLSIAWVGAFALFVTNIFEHIEKGNKR